MLMGLCVNWNKAGPGWAWLGGSASGCGLGSGSFHLCSLWDQAEGTAIPRGKPFLWQITSVKNQSPIMKAYLKVCVTSTNIPLAKASLKAKPNISGWELDNSQKVSNNEYWNFK